MVEVDLRMHEKSKNPFSNFGSASAFQQAALIAKTNLNDIGMGHRRDNKAYISPEKKAKDPEAMQNTPKGLSGLKRLPSLSPSEDKTQTLESKSSEQKTTTLDEE